MKTIILIQQHIRGINLVCMYSESSKNLFEGTFENWLKNESLYKFNWEHEEGREGSNYVEYTCGNYTAIYQRLQDTYFNDPNAYSVSRDDSLTFIGDLLYAESMNYKMNL